MSEPVDVFDRLLEIAMLLQADLERSFTGTDLTPARTHLLWVLHLAGPSTQRDVAAALDVTPRNVTGLVDALEASGHVRREPHPRDRRATLVALTDLGAQTMAGMERERAAAASALVAGFAPSRVARFARDLDAVAGRLRELVEEAGAS